MENEEVKNTPIESPYKPEIKDTYVEGMGTKTKRDGYDVEIKYSPEAHKRKLMRFTTPSGDQFVMSADEMINMLVEHVNLDMLAPTFVDITRVNVVNVKRSLMVRAQHDIKAGTEFAIGYTHPYPVEFALIEEAYKMALLQPDVKMVELTKEFIDKVKGEIELKPVMKEFTKNFYKSFKNVPLNKDDAPSEKPKDNT